VIVVIVFGAALILWTLALAYVVATCDIEMDG
jgi:hypothetical protein